LGGGDASNCPGDDVNVARIRSFGGISSQNPFFSSLTVPNIAWARFLFVLPVINPFNLLFLS
jgi:hypothetical protein